VRATRIRDILWVSRHSHAVSTSQRHPATQSTCSKPAVAGLVARTHAIMLLDLQLRHAEQQLPPAILRRLRRQRCVAIFDAGRKKTNSAHASTTTRWNQITIGTTTYSISCVLGWSPLFRSH